MAKLTRIKDLTPDSRNANKGTERGTGMLEQSLRSYGAGRSVLADKKGRIIAGNKTVEQCAAMGIDKVIEVQTTGRELVVVRRMDLDLETDVKAKELAIADNRIGQVSLDWDPAVLKELGEEINLDQFFVENELDKMFEDLAGSDLVAPEAQMDKASELQKKWKTARGQIWEIGRHRLMCDDSTASASVDTLFGKEKAWLLCTDPPYGVGYGKETGPDSAKRFTAMKGDDATGKQLQAFLELAFTASLPHLNNGAVWYLWHAQMTQGFFAAAAAAAAAAQVKVHRQIIWRKSHFVLGHGDYHWQHELCFYGWREGEKHRWFGDRAQSTMWDIENPKAHENHPTEKPIEIFSKPMQFNTHAGEICYEPFSGSGSQLVAAELLGRVCYAMEIEPKYVAVALERLAGMGLKPELVTQ